MSFDSGSVLEQAGMKKTPLKGQISLLTASRDCC